MVEQIQETKSDGRWQAEDLHQQVPQQAFSYWSELGHMQTLGKRVVWGLEVP